MLLTEDIGWRKYASRFRTFPKRIDAPRDPDIHIIVCIPVCAEPDLISTMEALFCSHRSCMKAEVILLFNQNSFLTPAEKILHVDIWKECMQWLDLHQRPEIKVWPLFIDQLPDPKGGVGWARKLAMDEAARRLDPNGIIVCLDADCTVDIHYLDTISEHFKEFKSQDAASIYYEHKVDHLEPLHRKAIIEYELHLRYLVNAQQWSGHPYAFATVGSAMAVRRKAYLEQGGMNTKRAGEDFYFLQKFIEIGSHGEIRNTTVYPSARISSRVPFGTGRAMQVMLSDHGQWETTDFQIFKKIKPLFQSLDKLRDSCLKLPPAASDYVFHQELGLSPDVSLYLRKIEFLEECRSIASQTANFAAFRKRFFRFFNSFRMIKYMHYMSDLEDSTSSVLESVAKLAREMKFQISPNSNEEVFLKFFRQYDREKR